MKTYRADLHIHTILSPCASLDMSPKNIVSKAVEKKLDIIGITDHNSTLQCEIVNREALKTGLKVYQGVEITTKEEIHCLAFFENSADLRSFQQVLNDHLPCIKNDTSIFGYQVVVDEDENIVFEEDRLLISALDLSIDRIELIVHQLNGIFIPAHANKPKDSIISQLGFIPLSLKADAFEITKNINAITFRKSNMLPDETVTIRNSDAHMLDDIGSRTSGYVMESTDFNEFRLALRGCSGRKVVSE